MMRSAVVKIGRRPCFLATSFALALYTAAQVLARVIIGSFADASPFKNRLRSTSNSRRKSFRSFIETMLADAGEIKQEA